MPEFVLNRGEAGALIYALRDSITSLTKQLQRERAKDQKTGKHRPGIIVGIACDIAEAQTLQARLISFATANGWLPTIPSAPAKPQLVPTGSKS
jgi:hypothetical protein